MGSVVMVVLVSSLLPAALRYAGDLALERHVAEHVPADAEQADVALRTAADAAAVVHAHIAAVGRQFLQALPITGGFELGAFGGVLLHHLGALALACLH